MAFARAGSLGRGWASRFSSFVQPLHGLVRRLRQAYRRGHVGRHHQPDLLAHVVEGQHFVEEQQAGIWNAQFIFCQLGQPLDLAHRIVSKKAHCPGRKGRQSRQPRRLVPASASAQHGEDVAFESGRSSGLR